MRETLIRILDEIGIPAHIGIRSSSSLWSQDAGQVHFSSALRWPVFCEQKDKYGQHHLRSYTGGTPGVTSLPIFIGILQDVLVPEIEELPADCVIAPLGAAATTALSFACKRIPGFKQSRLLVGLPHPGGAARDISSQFLGDPPRRTRKKPLNPSHRQAALSLRAQVLALGDAREAFHASGL